MARIADVGRYHINMDHVISITPPHHKGGSIWIELVNGQQLEVDGMYLDELAGANHIVQIIAVEGVYATVGGENDTEDKFNVHVLAVMADGYVRELDASCYSPEFFDTLGEYRGIYWKQDELEK